MAILLDTSVLGRLANRADQLHIIARAAIAELHRRGEVLHVTPQNLIEFRSFATRPANANGLGLAQAEVEGLAAVFETAFPMLVETADIYPAWKAICGEFNVVGKQVHDARLVAVCRAHRVSQILTFNVAHFARYAELGPRIVVIDPSRF
jgi:predicted nucleic acid-binding protein